MGAVERGSRAFRIINFSFFIAGFVTFVTLYDLQPLLPFFVREFHVAPAAASLAVSLATGGLAVAMLVAGTLSETLGRRPVMIVALLGTSALALLSALSGTFLYLLLVRLLQGIVLAGLPAVAMAYLGEEMAPSALGSAMGLYIAGNAVGGMSGRIFTVAMTDLLPWRLVLAIIGGGCLVMSLLFVRMLPSSGNFRRRTLDLRSLSASLLGHLKNPALRYLYAIAFLAMGGFVTVYNYLTFRLLAPPYRLAPAVVGWIFLVYLVGSFSSALAGRLIERVGRTRVVALSLVLMFAGVLLTLTGGLVVVVCGIVLVTAGFFGTHSVASGWVARVATQARAQASALYLFFYYLGSSVCGTLGGVMWSRFHWSGIVLFVSLLVSTAGGVLIALSRRVARSEE